MNRDMHALAAELRHRFEFDLVHSHDWLVAGAAGVAARDIERRWLVTVHATEYGRHQGWVQHHPQSHIHAAERAMARRADHVITCSGYMRATSPACSASGREDHRDPERDRSARPRARRVGLPRCVPCSPRPRAARAAGRPSRLREGLPPRARRARAAAGAGRRPLRGRRHRHRGGRAQAPGPPAGTARARHVPGLGRRRHAPLPLPGADLCIVPSIYEPFGLVALEAMASDACAWSPTPAVCVRSCRSTAPSACASLRATQPPCARPRTGPDRRRRAWPADCAGARARAAVRLGRGGAAHRRGVPGPRGGHHTRGMTPPIGRGPDPPRLLYAHPPASHPAGPKRARRRPGPPSANYYASARRSGSLDPGRRRLTAAPYGVVGGA